MIWGRDRPKDPDWYEEWWREAFRDLQDKNDRLRAEFQLGAWPSYSYDLDAGTLTFFDQNGARVIAQVQVVGSTSTKADNWLWAWANSHLPAACVKDSEEVRAFGKEHGIRELADEIVKSKDLNPLGWKLAADATRLTDAWGAYRAPSKAGALYLTYKKLAWVA
jgi:hypothetical protein